MSISLAVRCDTEAGLVDVTRSDLACSLAYANLYQHTRTRDGGLAFK
jgi:hypothetical protein